MEASDGIAFICSGIFEHELKKTTTAIKAIEIWNNLFFMGFLLNLYSFKFGTSRHFNTKTGICLGGKSILTTNAMQFIILLY